MDEETRGSSGELRRRVLLCAFAFVIPWLPLIAWMRADSEPYVVPAYGSLTALFVVLFLGLLTRRLPIRVAELGAVATIVTVVFVRLAVAVLDPGLPTLQLRRLVVEMSGPSLIACVLVIFLALELRQARVIAGAISVLFAGLVAAPIVSLLPDDTSTAGAMTGQVVMVGVVLGLAYGLASVRSQLAAEQTRARDLVELANTDPLTGVCNRRGAEQILSRQLATVSRYGGELSLALLDVDRFKERNDHHGHAAGDEALVTIVEALRAQLRGSDVLGRWGGDELLVVVPGTPPAQVHLSADRWRRLVAELGLEAGRHTLTVSIGVATFRAGDDVDALLRRADRAMYAVKARGGDGVQTDAGDADLTVVSPAPGSGSASAGSGSAGSVAEPREHS